MSDSYTSWLILTAARKQGYEEQPIKCPGKIYLNITQDLQKLN